MESLYFFHVFRLPFAFISSVFAFGFVAPILKSKLSRGITIGLLIIFEVMVSIYLIENGPASSAKTNDKSGSFKFNLENSTFVMETTIMVCISKMCLFALFGVGIYCCTNGTGEEKGITPTTVAAIDVPNTLFGQPKPDLPPPYHEAIPIT